MATRRRATAKSVEDEGRFLADVPAEYIFWCHSGRTFKNLQELGEGLATMTEDIYAYHANAEKNDFVSWIRDIIKDEKLAKELAKIKTRTGASNRVARRVAELSGIPAE